MPANRPNLRPPAGGLLIANPPAPRTPAPGLPLSRRPAPRHLLATLALAVLLIAASAPAVSASELVNEHLSLYVDTSVSRSEPVTTTSISGVYNFDRIHIKKIENHKNTAYFSLTIDSNQAKTTTYMPEGRHTIEYTMLGQTKPCVVYCQHNKNILGQTTSAVYTIFPQDWDVGTGAGPQYITFSEYLFQDRRGLTKIYVSTDYGVTDYRNDYDIAPCSYEYVTSKRFEYFGPWGAYNIFVSSNQGWENNLFIETVEPDLLHVMVEREIDGKGYESDLTLKNNGNVTYYHTGVLNFDQYFPPSLAFDTAILTDPAGNNYTYVIGAGTAPINPTSAPVTVYIQNSQTGALLADARLSILASAGGTETEIINTTLPGGTATYTLQPTGGGSPNPDYYRAVATVPGYTQIVENHSFTLNGPHDVIIEMRPDTGGPLDPDRAYLEFYVRDIHANPISSASVQCDGRIKTTNSQGYAVFEVAKNATYPYVAKKSGYVTIEGTATVADGPRYVANVVLGPGTVPTHTPTLGPGETPGGPGATPTPDTRTNEQKGQAIIDLIADFAEPIAILAILATIFGLMKMMTPGRR